jgi:hypothetical protein
MTTVAKERARVVREVVTVAVVHVAVVVIVDSVVANLAGVVPLVSLKVLV